MPKYICSTLKLDLEHLGTVPRELDLVLERASDSALFEELHLDGCLQANLQVFSIGDRSFHFEGKLQGVQLLTCSRTLEPFLRPFETDMVFEVMKDETIRVQVMDDEDEELFVFRIPVLQESVEITECIRQLVVLQEPINPVKDPGKEFTWKDPAANEPNKLAAMDPRWEKLKELKQKLEKPQ